jgi:hypothetical protein
VLRPQHIQGLLAQRLGVILTSCGGGPNDFLTTTVKFVVVKLHHYLKGVVGWLDLCGVSVHNPTA